MNGHGAAAGVRNTILQLVGRGFTAAEIRERIGPIADDADLQYADSLVKVRDEVRSEKLQTQVRPARAAA
jgi:hypothetical protein